eukprot:11178994-Lingulodinium_polyedra.AAC.1
MVRRRRARACIHPFCPGRAVAFIAPACRPPLARTQGRSWRQVTTDSIVAMVHLGLWCQPTLRSSAYA